MTRYTLYVCPDCGEWYPDMANGFPLHSACEHKGHREALAVECVPVATLESLRLDRDSWRHKSETDNTYLLSRALKAGAELAACEFSLVAYKQTVADFERRLRAAEAALRTIRDHAHDEDWWDARATCPNAFHVTHYLRRAEGAPEWCPDCYSSWWATRDEMPPSSPSYAVEAVARETLGDD